MNEVAADDLVVPRPNSSSSPTRDMEAEEDPPEVFLCAECNLIFHTKAHCIQHMKQIHDLKEFSFSEIELIEESKKSVVQRRKVSRLYFIPSSNSS